MIGYGSVDLPFNEAFGRIVEVHWGGKAIDIRSPDGYQPLAKATTPAALVNTGSWCSWFYSDESLSTTNADGWLQARTGSFAGFGADIRGGFVSAEWVDPGIVGSGYGLFPWANWTNEESDRHWTIRPDDSIAVVHTVDFDPNDFYYRADLRDMDFGKWHLIQMSWDLSGGRKTIAIDDVAKTVVFEPEPFTGFWDGSLQDDSGAIPSYRSTFYLMLGAARRYDWWLSSEYVDFSVTANRRRFVTADKKPVALGADGSRGSPTSRRPEFFFHPGATLTDFSNNRGTAGAIQWTTDAGVTGSYLIDPTWSSTAKPTTAGA